MFSSFAASQKDILVRELAAMAASHSVATQQQTYRSDALVACQAVTINDFYRRKCKLIEDEMSRNSALPYISDAYARDLTRDLQEVAKMKEDRFLRNEAARERDEIVRENRTLTSDVRYQIFQLIISMA